MMPVPNLVIPLIMSIHFRVLELVNIAVRCALASDILNSGSPNVDYALHKINCGDNNQ